eukprot:765871-Hanusia_phi.AAC.1
MAWEEGWRIYFREEEEETFSEMKEQRGKKEKEMLKELKGGKKKEKREGKGNGNGKGEEEDEVETWGGGRKASHEDQVRDIQLRHLNQTTGNDEIGNDYGEAVVSGRAVAARQIKSMENEPIDSRSIVDEGTGRVTVQGQQGCLKAHSEEFETLEPKECGVDQLTRADCHKELQANDMKKDQGSTTRPGSEDEDCRQQGPRQNSVLYERLFHKYVEEGLLEEEAAVLAMMEISSRCPFKDLDVDLLAKVFNSLTPREILRCSCVCGQWKQVALSDVIWESQCRSRGWTRGHRAWGSRRGTCYQRFRDLMGRRVFAWGSGEYGQIGLVDEKQREMTSREPMEVTRFRSQGVVHVACGSAHSACVLACGKVFTWGCGKYGRLGHGGEVREGGGGRQGDAGVGG